MEQMARGRQEKAGYTNSTNFPVSGGHDMAHNGGPSDAFLMKFSPQGALLWSTFLGGGENDYGYRGIPDGLGNVYFFESTYAHHYSPRKSFIPLDLCFGPPRVFSTV